MGIDNLGNVMLDLEAIGDVITSIAAIEFDINTGQTGRRIYIKVDIDSSLKLGLKISGETIDWWMQQDDAARLEMATGDKVNITHALFLFREFLQNVGTTYMWANRGDFSIMELSYKALGKQIPWLYRLERDVLTLSSIVPKIRKNMKFIGVKHNPIDDCLHQIRYCTETWQHLNVDKDE